MEEEENGMKGRHVKFLISEELSSGGIIYVLCFPKDKNRAIIDMEGTGRHISA